MEYLIQNQYISKELKIINDHLVTGSITNKRDGTVLIPDGNGGEFFVALMNGERISSKVIFIEKIEQDDGSLTILFKEYQGMIFTLRYTLGEDDHFIKKHISFTTIQDVEVDYIDLENIGITGAKKTWTIPEMEKVYNDGYYCQIGQPVYIDSFFIGSEFPASENMVIGSEAHVRYYKGEKFVSGSTFHTPIAVIGAARSDNMDVLKNDFMEYIKTISIESDFRIQYNSWYDYMLDITAENIEKSFYEIEKGLTQHGVPPIDSYVVDDGWVNYKSTFWCFNKKFPNELYDSSALANKFSSNFGLWLGPRGGYNGQTLYFAKRMQKAGTGAYNPKSFDVCVASSAYLKNVKALFLDYTEKFDLNYWKLDGFILEPCPKKDHGHKTGGYREMYFITEAWENWIDIFQSMHALRESKGKSMWLNLTSYAHLSPWWMQYVNSVWLQNSSDMDFEKNVPGQRQLDQVLTYRDERYYDIVRVRQQQFPLSAIYNHEPIYGNTAKISFTDEEFEKYLFMIATRGNAFWELYYSYSMMNDKKWDANARALKWAKSNFHILKNAQFIGESPAKNNVYGYSSWDGSDGVLSVRNPYDKEQEFKVVLNKELGVTQGVSNLNKYLVYGTFPDLSPISYGDELTFKLKPFEVVILQFGETDRRYEYKENSTPLSVTFTCPEKDGVILKNEDVTIEMRNGAVVFTCDTSSVTASCPCTGKPAAAVAEINGMIKLYVDGVLNNSDYRPDRKTEICTAFTENPFGCTIEKRALDYTSVPGYTPASEKKKGIFAKLFGKK